MTALTNTGIAPPPAVAASPLAQVSGWYDPAKWNTANPLAGINSWQASNFVPAYQTGTDPYADYMYQQAAAGALQGNSEGGGGGGMDWSQGPAPASLTDPWGTGHTLTQNADGTFSYTDKFNDPSGSSKKDQMGVTYQYDPKTGMVTPTAASSFYQPSDWVGTWRDAAATLAAVVGAGFGGAALAGAGEGAAGAGAAAGEGMSGMDLAADAALGSGNNVVTAGSMLGGEAAAPTATEIANTGSDAHFYQPQAGGTGVQDLANMGGAGSAVTPTWTGAGAPTSPLSQLGSTLKNAGVGDALNAMKTILPIVGAIKGSGGGSGSAPAGNPALPASAPADMGRASRYAYEGFVADPNGQPSRPGHTMGPSSAVNLNDPSAAMFGYGKVPIYFQRPGTVTTGGGSPVVPGTPPAMAEGGSVMLDDYGNPLDMGSSSGPLADNTDTGGDVYGRMTAADPSDAHLLSPLLGGINSRPGTGQATVDNNTSADSPLMAWLKSYGAKDAAARNKFGMGFSELGIGLLAQLLHHNAVAPGYQTVSQLRGGLPSGNGAVMTPQQIAAMSTYFNAPAARYVPPPARGPFGVKGYAAGGAALDAMRDAHGVGSPEVFNPSIHGSYVAAGHGGGQDDRVDASLSPGEYVWDADVVSALGDGNNAHGARVLDAAREAIRAHKRSAPPDSIPPKALSPLTYIKMGGK